MIQANELRIGNYVKDATLGFYIRFHSSFGLCNAENRPDEFDPIPLTPEILEKAGFEKKRYNDFYFCYCKGDFVFPYDGKYFFYCTYNETGLFGYSEEVEIMVHQLQNLYFALTGEELEINL